MQPYTCVPVSWRHSFGRHRSCWRCYGKHSRQQASGPGTCTHACVGPGLRAVHSASRGPQDSTCAGPGVMRTAYISCIELVCQCYRGGQARLYVQEGLEGGVVCVSLPDLLKPGTPSPHNCHKRSSSLTNVTLLQHWQKGRMVRMVMYLGMALYQVQKSTGCADWGFGAVRSAGQAGVRTGLVCRQLCEFIESSVHARGSVLCFKYLVGCTALGCIMLGKLLCVLVLDTDTSTVRQR